MFLVINGFQIHLSTRQKKKEKYAYKIHKKEKNNEMISAEYYLNLEISSKK